ncbi:hypothetical protein GIB67_009611 [Kingdonia uniflora]|uniref:procollagen-proline 4-dioxygenase n=1 Tax=Kingdonia uniflora TaxID=39325 RepID=A0A7J7M2B8_9MAGN|nr:hypothetical protein GIB67_009611 [Kingdonia uniflora]
MASPLSITLMLWLLLWSHSICYAQSYRKELRMKNEVNRHSIIQLGSYTQSTRIDPSQVTRLSWHPRVFMYRGFLSDEECDHLISLAHGEKDKLVKDNGSRKIQNTNSVPLANSMIPLAITQDAIVSRIEERASAWSFIPKENGDTFQILRYAPEEAKHNRLNYYEDKPLSGSGQPLLATLLKGTQPKDETWSECAKKGFTVKPIRGNALLFFNLHLNAAPDNNSLHARCPVLQGEKWCAIKSFHLRTTEEKKKKKDLLEPDGDECTDEDDRCPGWVATGECQKNPVYMIGTPDYYGSCRKSCNAC